MSTDVPPKADAVDFTTVFAPMSAAMHTTRRLEDVVYTLQR